MNAQTPQSLAAEVESLFTLPDVVLRLNKLLDAPEVNTHEISAVVELDPGLASSVLRLSNSPVFGQHGKVGSVTRAIDLIGQKALRNLVLATSVTQVFTHIPEEFVDMTSFWDNSITSGVAAQLLARLAHLRDTESLFLTGLLHGVGRLVFYMRRPDEYRALLAEKPQNDHELAAAEQRTFGFTYAELGAALLANWSLPAHICTAVQYQLKPQAVAGEHAREVAIIHIANDIAASLSPCLKQRDAAFPWEPRFDPRAAETLGVSLEDMEAVRLEALAQTFEVIVIINPHSTLIF
jgi:HD-like signal output (HDOD) protein